MNGNNGGKVALDVHQAHGVNISRVINRAYVGVVPLLFFLATLTYIDRSNVAFASLQFLDDLHLTTKDYGLGAGIFYIGYCVMQIPSQMAITRVGAPIWLAILVFCWGAVAAASAGMNSRNTYIGVRFLLGVFEAGCFPGCWYSLSVFFTSLELGFAYACVSSSTALSNIIGAPLAAGLLYLDGRGGLHGWQWIFIVEGCLTAIYAFVILALLPRRPGTAWFLNGTEKTWLQGRQDTLDAKAHARDARAGKWWGCLLKWELWYLSVCYALVQWSITAVVYFNPLLVESILGAGFGKPIPPVAKADKPWHTAKIALISAVLWVPTGIVMMVVAWSSKKYQERNLHTTIPVYIAGACFMAVPATAYKNAIAGYVLLIVAATGVWAVHGPMWSWPKTFLHGEGAAVGIAIFNSVGALGGFCGPYVTGALFELRGGRQTAMFVLGAINFALGTLILFFRPAQQDEHVSSQEEHDAMHAADARGPPGAPAGGKAPEWGATVNPPAHKDV